MYRQLLAAPALILLLVAGSHAFAAQTNPGEWCHASMQSTSGVALRLDYQVAQQHPDQYTYLNVATNPWLNLSAAGWQGREDVRAVFLTYSVSFTTSNPDGDATLQQTIPLTLTWDGSQQKYTAEVPGTIPTEEYQVGNDQTFPYRYEIAVVVNGTWLTDPVNQTHNFRYWPYNQASGDCRGYGITVN